MAIVVVYEDSDGSFEMLAIQDKQPVETFVSDGSHETLGDGIRLRCPKRRPHDLDPFCSKHLVETRRELLIAVPDQEPERLRPTGECPRQLSRLLRDPRCGRRRRATGQVDAAAAQLDEEEHVQPLQPHGLHGEEIHREHTLTVQSDELPPRHAPARADRSHASLA